MVLNKEGYILVRREKDNPLYVLEIKKNKEFLHPRIYRGIKEFKASNINPSVMMHGDYEMHKVYLVEHLENRRFKYKRKDLVRKDTREEYIEFFKDMQKKLEVYKLSGRNATDIAWAMYLAVDEQGLFTQNELAEMFPKLLGGFNDDQRRVDTRF